MGSGRPVEWWRERGALLWHGQRTRIGKVARFRQRTSRVGGGGGGGGEGSYPSFASE